MATSAAIRQHLVDALGLDLIGPSWHNVARRHEQLSQPPSVWYTTGFLVPHVFEQEDGRTTEDEQLSFADLAGEEPSNEASHRLEKQEKDDDANDRQHGCRICRLPAAGQVIRAGPDHVDLQGLNKLFADLGGGEHGSNFATLELCWQLVAVLHQLR